MFMRKVIATTCLFLFMAVTSKSQSNYRVEAIDSVSKSKEQIYSDTKMFIAENWKSAKAVIQNDDKEAGLILVRAVNIQTATTVVVVTFTYDYTVKFQMKDNRYKITIDGVSCNQALWGNTPYSGCVEPCDSCDLPGYGKTGLSKSQSAQVLASLKSELSDIVVKYKAYLRSAKNNSGDW